MKTRKDQLRGSKSWIIKIKGKEVNLGSFIEPFLHSRVHYYCSWHIYLSSHYIRIYSYLWNETGFGCSICNYSSISPTCLNIIFFVRNIFFTKQRNCCVFAIIIWLVWTQIMRVIKIRNLLILNPSELSISTVSGWYNFQGSWGCSGNSV